MKVSEKLFYLFALANGVLVGYGTGIISGMLGYLDKSLTITPNTFYEGVIVAAIALGAIIGSILFYAYFSMRSRKVSLAIAVLLFTIGALLSGLCINSVVLLFGRFIFGIAIGFSSILIPKFLSEVIDSTKKGLLSFLNQLSIVLGLLLAYVVNFVVVHINNDPNSLLGQYNDFNISHGWRISVLLSLVFIIIMSFGVFALPESPHYLVIAGKFTQAREVLSRIRTSIKEIDAEITEIEADYKVPSAKVSSLFKPNMTKVLVAVVGITVFQQFMGINTIIYYAPKIFETIGFDTYQSRMVTVAIGVTNIIATLIAIIVVDKLKRKKLFVFGGLFMAAFTGLFAFLIKLNFHQINAQIVSDITINDGVSKTLIMICASILLCLYIIAFGVTWGGAMWVVLGEILPLEIRSAGVNVSSVINSLSSAILIIAFPVLLNAISMANTYLIMCVICILGVLFVIKFLPETHEKTSEEIEMAYAK